MISLVKVEDFSTSDETDESILEALDWWMMALMPGIPLMGYFTDDTGEERLERLYRTAGVMSVSGAAAYLAGAGSSMPNPASLRSGAALFVEKYRVLGSTAARVTGVVARGAIRSLPLVGLYLVARGYAYHLASLDWVPDLYQNPLE